MTARFADTSYYVALVNARDEFHEQAVELSRDLHIGLVTTKYVLVELGNWLSKATYRAAYVSAIERVQADPHTLVHRESEELFQRGFELFAERPDKDWSMTDCISLVVMAEHRLTEAISADRHFEQAGFKILLK